MRTLSIYKIILPRISPNGLRTCLVADRIFPNLSSFTKLRILLIFFGFITSAFWVAAMITPWDLYGSTHLLLGIIYTTTGVVVLLVLAIMIFLKDSYPNKYAIILIYYFGLSISYC